MRGISMSRTITSGHSRRILSIANNGSTAVAITTMSGWAEMAALAT